MATQQIPNATPSGRARPSPPPLRRRQAAPPRRTSQWAPFIRIAPAIILLIGVLLPVELRVNIAGQTIYGYRMAWLAVSPWVIFQIVRGYYQPRFADALVAIASLWMVVSFSAVDGISKGAPAGLALALDILMPYLIIRASIRNLTDFRCFLIVIAPFAVILSALLVLESITFTRFIRSAAQSVFGSIGVAEYGNVARRFGTIDTRFGFMRAMGPFSHPILAGLFFAGLLPLFYFSRLRGWPWLFGLASGVGAFFTFSSAAVLGIAMFIGLAFYDWLRKVVSFLTWPLFLSVAGVTLLVLHLISERGLISVLIRSTINPSSGYYRLLIWDYGVESVQNNPWFGIAYTPFQRAAWMSESVDTIWLALAIRHGFIVPAALALAMLMAIVGLCLAAGRTRGADSGTYIGMAITLSLFFILGFTVSFFGGLLIWFAMLLAIGTTFSQFGRAQGMPLRRPMLRQVTEPRTNRDG